MVSVNGGRSRSNNANVNGGAAGDPMVNSPSIEPSPDTISEFRVISHDYDAALGPTSTRDVATRHYSSSAEGAALGASVRVSRDDSRLVGNSYLILRCPACLVFSGAHNGHGTITVDSGTKPRLHSPRVKWCVCTVGCSDSKQGFWYTGFGYGGVVAKVVFRVQSPPPSLSAVAPLTL